MYANPVTNTTYSTGFPSSDPVLSDCTDDYAEPDTNWGQPKLSSPSFSDNIYSQAFPPPDHPPLLQYASPAIFTPPTVPRPANHYQDTLCCTEDRQFLPFSSSLSSADILYSVTNTKEYQSLTRSKTPQYSKVKKVERIKSHEHKPKSFERIHKKVNLDQRKATSKVNPNLKLKSVNKSQLIIVERLGTGQFGEVHLCHYLGSFSSSLVAVKSLDRDCSSDQR